MTKKVGGEKVTLSLSDYVKLGSMFLVVISLLISVKVDVATDKERINQLEIQNIFQKNYNNDQRLINKCVENAIAVEFGKNLYYYNDQLVYRIDNKNQ
jgi:hypothetical protein